MNMSMTQIYVISPVGNDSVYMNNVIAGNDGSYKLPTFGSKGCQFSSARQAREAMTLYEIIREIKGNLPEIRLRKLKIHYEELALEPEEEAPFTDKKRAIMSWGARHGPGANLSKFSRTMETDKRWDEFAFVASVSVEAGQWDWPTDKFVGHYVKSRKYEVRGDSFVSRPVDWQNKEVLAIALTEEVDLTFLTLCAGSTLRAYKFRTGEQIF